MLVLSIIKHWWLLMELVVGLNLELIQPFIPKNYANCILIRINELFQKNADLYLNNPKKLIIESCELNKETGSCTVLVLTLDQNEPKLHSALIGDSGYMILRPKMENPYKFDVFFRSKEQQYEFNFPYQVGTNGTKPNLASVNQHEVKLNDVIIAGTDGLFDNLFDENILELVEGYLKIQKFDSQQIANVIAKKAFEKSMDRNWKSPFAVNAIKAGYRSQIGGKEDDITVAIGKIEAIE